jgi:hypothetical protein
MKTHAEVHEEVERIIQGTRLQTFMVTTNSFRSEDGTVAVEWACTISSGRQPEFFFRSRDPNTLVEEVRKGVDRRRAFFAVPSLDTLRGVPPKDTALPDPKQSDARHYDPTGEVQRP